MRSGDRRIYGIHISEAILLREAEASTRLDSETLAVPNAIPSTEGDPEDTEPDQEDEDR